MGGARPPSQGGRTPGHIFAHCCQLLSLQQAGLHTSVLCCPSSFLDRSRKVTVRLWKTCCSVASHWSAPRCPVHLLFPTAAFTGQSAHTCHKVSPDCSVVCTGQGGCPRGHAASLPSSRPERATPPTTRWTALQILNYCSYEHTPIQGGLPSPNVPSVPWKGLCILARGRCAAPTLSSVAATALPSVGCVCCSLACCGRTR